MKSALAWKTINEVCGRNKSNKAKLKETSDKERIKRWHNHFKEVLGNNIQSTINSENSTQILNKLEIKLPLRKRKVIKATTNISKNISKSVGLDEIPAEV